MTREETERSEFRWFIGLSVLSVAIVVGCYYGGTYLRPTPEWLAEIAERERQQIIDDTGCVPVWFEGEWMIEVRPGVYVHPYYRLGKGPVEPGVLCRDQGSKS